MDFYGLRDRGEFVRLLSEVLASRGCEAYSRGSSAWIRCLIDICTSEDVGDECGLSGIDKDRIVEFWSERLSSEFTQWIP